MKHNPFGRQLVSIPTMFFPAVSVDDRSKDRVPSFNNWVYQTNGYMTLP